MGEMGAADSRTHGRLTNVFLPIVLLACAVAGAAQELRPGVWGGRDLSGFPLPVADYDVYMIGELHGVKENYDVAVQYAAKLHEAAGLREIAIEDKQAYESEAQAYVEGRSDTLPAPLCGRAGIFRAIRRFNEGRKDGDRLVVRLVDIDYNPEAIREHLVRVKQRVKGADAVMVPALTEIKAQGLDTVAALEKLTSDAEVLAQLRTIRHSIRTYQQGLVVYPGRDFTGSPYLDDREDAIVSNIRDLLRKNPGTPVLAFYGIDHVQKNLIRYGGPKQDHEFEPTAMRLTSAGVKVYSMVMVPLTGGYNWRGRAASLEWSAADGGLSTGEKFDALLASSPGTTLLYIDPKREPAKMAASDLTRTRPDAFLLFAHGTPAEDFCAAAQQSEKR